jgi:DNA-binding NarL/FixJ family response regulator
MQSEGFMVKKWPTNSQIQILLVDHHAITRVGLRSILSQMPDMVVVGEAACGAEALRQVVRRQPDLVLIDPLLSSLTGSSDNLEIIRRIRRAHPGGQVVVLTESSDGSNVLGAIQAGAIGFLLKDIQPEELVRALRAAVRSEPALHPEAQRILMRESASVGVAQPRLTERELDVLRLITQGKRNKEIAATLYLTEGTVKGYISIILEKLAVHDRTQAALYAVRHRLVAEA